MMKLRGTQGDFVDRGVEILTSKSTKKSIMVAPVAYGKSICIANIVLKLDAPSIILQPNKELLEQNYSKYTSYGYSASICCASMKTKQKQGKMYTVVDGKLTRCDEVSEVTYATIGSIKKYAEIVKKLGVKYLIIDECHINSGTVSTLRDFIRETKIKNILGVTATAIVLRSTMSGSELRMMDRTGDNLFSTLSYVVQIQEVVKHDYWSKLVYKVRPAKLGKLAYNTSGSDFTQQSMSAMYVENDSENRTVAAVDYLIGQGRKSILIFVPLVADAINLGKKISGSKVVTGKTDKVERKQIIEDFKNLIVTVVINVEILTTGFDHPRLDGMILTRPTASISLYYQMLGRATRIHPLKEDAMIIDLSGNVEKFGRIEDLNYEYIDGYGWGLFNEDILLTGYPLKSKSRPTKKLLAKSATSVGTKTVAEHGKTKIWFGKHKGKMIRDIPVFYLTFMVETFDFNGTKMIEFKKSLETYLKLI